MISSFFPALTHPCSEIDLLRRHVSAGTRLRLILSHTALNSLHATLARPPQHTLTVTQAGKLWLVGREGEGARERQRERGNNGLRQVLDNYVTTRAHNTHIATQRAGNEGRGSALIDRCLSCTRHRQALAEQLARRDCLAVWAWRLVTAAAEIPSCLLLVQGKGRERQARLLWWTQLALWTDSRHTCLAARED